jgi:hypothetical protein
LNAEINNSVAQESIKPSFFRALGNRLIAIFAIVFWFAFALGGLALFIYAAYVAASVNWNVRAADMTPALGFNAIATGFMPALGGLISWALAWAIYRSFTKKYT